MDLQNSISDNVKAANLKQKVQKLIEEKKKTNGASALFKVQTEPDTKTTSKLAKDRFFAKKTDMPIGLERKIDILARKHQKGLFNLTQENPEKKPEMFDMWGGNSTKNPEILTKNAVRRQNNVNVGLTDVPAIMKPKGGESYNPSSKSHTELLQHIVNQDDQLENGVQNPSKVKDLTSRLAKVDKLKPRSKKEKKVWEELEIKRKAKDLKMMEYHYGKYLKDAKKEKVEHAKKLDDRKKHKDDIKEKLRKGELAPVRRKIGKRNYKPRVKEFENLDEMKGTLKNMTANTPELLREQYDNIFRTGKIEPPTGGKKKNRGTTNWKAHNIYETSMRERVIKTQKKSNKGDDLVVL